MDNGMNTEMKFETETRKNFRNSLKKYLTKKIGGKFRRIV